MPLFHVSDLMAVVIGVVCGILAAIPFSILILSIVAFDNSKLRHPQEMSGEEGATLLADPTSTLFVREIPPLALPVGREGTE